MGRATKILSLLSGIAAFCLLVIHPIYGAEVNLLGEWHTLAYIRFVPPGSYIRDIEVTVEETKVPRRAGETQYKNWQKIKKVPWIFPSQVNQHDGGTFSGSIYIDHSTNPPSPYLYPLERKAISVTLSGSVSGTSVSFRRSCVITEDDGETATFTEDYTGTFEKINESYSHIRGTFRGSYYEKDEWSEEEWRITQVARNDSYSGNFNISIEKDLPQVYFTSGPDESSHYCIDTSTATFSWAVQSSVRIKGYYYQLDCLPEVYTEQTNATFNNLDYGRHSFCVKAVNIQDSIGDAKTYFEIVPPYPETTITYFDTTLGYRAVFVWWGSSFTSQVAGYYYRFDSQPQVYTNSRSITFNDLNPGDHCFSVAAKDAKGRVDPTPAVLNFNIPARQRLKLSPPAGYFLGTPADRQQTAGDPINNVTGNMYMVTQDLFILGRGLNFDFIRAYNSDAYELGPLGYGWTHSYNLSLENSFGVVFITDGQGKVYWFYEDIDGVYVPQRGDYSSLVKTADGFTWTHKDGKKYFFNSTGRLTQLKDRNDNTLSLSYDAKENLVSVTDTVGRRIDFSYDSSNRITRITDPLNRSFTYAYDADSNLIRVTDPKLNSTVYAYDEDAYLIRKTDAKGNVISFSYGEDGYCLSSSGVNNIGRVNLTFDETNKKTVIKDSKGNATTQFYNSDNLVTKVIGPAGGEVNSTWDRDFNLTSRSDEKGNTTQMEYDSAGNLIRLTDAEGKATIFSYEPNFNRLKTVTDPDGNLTSYSYDTKGNLLEAKDALGNTTTYTYNSAGQPLSLTDALGHKTTFSYDTQGNLEKVTDALGKASTFQYDGLGNLTEAKDPAGNITRYEYDVLNQLSKVTAADNSLTRFEYDPAGNRTKITDNALATTSFAYDPANRLQSVTDPQGNKVIYDYDSEGNLTSITDPLGQKTSYEYDSLNRLTTLSDARSNKKQYAYDSVGNLILLTDANGQRISYEYDSLNRLTKIIYPDSQVSFGYDLLGRRSSLSDASGLVLYAYDSLGRLTKVDGPKANDSLEYTYDLLGQRLTLTDPENKITRYSYDALGRLSSITDPQGKVVSYGYDASGNLTSLVYPNGIRTSYSYDSLNRLLKLTQAGITDPSQKLAEFSYTYDPSGRKSRVSFLEGSIDYGYDAAGRLTSENANLSGNSSQISYGYDAAGNRLTKIAGALRFDYCYNELNQLTEENISSPAPRSLKIPLKGRITNAAKVNSVKVNSLNASFDGTNFSCFGLILNEGRNTITVQALDAADKVLATKAITVTYSPAKRISYTYDKNGNLSKRQSELKATDFSYDIENRLTKVITQGKEMLYEYDAEGKRISLKDGSTTTNYLYDGLNVLAERNSSGQVTASYTRNPFAAGGIGGLISGQGLSPQGTAPEVYYLYDGQGNVVGLVDSTGAQLQSYSYDAFGNLASQSGTLTNPYQFSTKSLEPSGLIYFGARYYDPRLGRFLTQDPSGMVDGPNLYLYCGNDPINWIDPWGLCGERASLLGWQNWLNKKLNVDATNRYFDSNYYWVTYLNSVAGNSQWVTLGIVTTVVAPFPLDVVAGLVTFSASSGFAIDAYRQAWLLDNPSGNTEIYSEHYYEDAGVYYRRRR